MSSPANIAGYCRACGKALEADAAIAAEGALYCREHAPVAQAPATDSTSPYSAPASPGTLSSPPQPPPPLPNGRPAPSPVLAFFLGMIPGVGAVYNGQYMKGLAHVLILGLMISILSNGSARGYEPLVGIAIPCFWAYMCIEAYHTAKKHRAGGPVREMSGLVQDFSSPSRFPAGAVALIVIGTLFLLDNLDLLKVGRLLRYWPVLLIASGLHMLYERLRETKNERP